MSSKIRLPKMASQSITHGLNEVASIECKPRSLTASSVRNRLAVIRKETRTRLESDAEIWRTDMVIVMEHSAVYTCSDRVAVIAVATCHQVLAIHSSSWKSLALHCAWRSRTASRPWPCGSWRHGGSPQRRSKPSISESIASIILL